MQAIEMQKRRLGNSDLEITPLGFGAWAIGGGDYAYGWGDQDDRESVGAILRAVEYGINWIDTAAVYGFGRSEEVVARALGEISANDRPYVFTKCGLIADGNGGATEVLTRDSIRRECEASLRRLGVEAIDLYQIHWPTDEIADIDEGWGAMAELQREGKVRWIGVSNFNVAEMERALKIAPITSLQPPYSLIQRDIETSILPFCADQEIGVIAYSPMGSGMLTGTMTRERIAALPQNDWRSRSPRFREPQLTRNLQLVDLLQRIADRDHHTVSEVALAWVLRDPAVTGAIVGARSAHQIDDWIGAGNYRLSRGEIDEIADFLA